MSEFADRYGSEEQCASALEKMHWPAGCRFPRCDGSQSYRFRECFRRLGASMWRALIAWVAAGACLVAFTSAHGQGQAPARPAASPAPAPASAASPSANPVRQAAEQRGFATCGARVEQVTNFLGFSPAAGAFLMAPGAPTGGGAGNRRLLPLVMELPLGPTSAFVTASFAPNAGSAACDATYDAVVYWPQPCEGVVAGQFASLRRLGLLKRDVLVLDGGPATKVFLMTAGAGCISVKKEVVL